MFHDLRHTFGTLCAASGIPVGDIQTYMGHSHVQTTQIYMHHAPKHDAAEKLLSNPVIEDVVSVHPAEPQV